MQIRFDIDISAEDYVRLRAWEWAWLDRCPLHPDGGCRFARHGTYERAYPPGTLIARLYCPDGHMTFSLLPDCLCSRLSATLQDVEEIVFKAESFPSVAAAAKEDTRYIEPAGARRWLQRRIFLVTHALNLLIHFMPEMFAGCSPTISSFRYFLKTDSVLPLLRQTPAPYLHQLPHPLGFCPIPARQHLTGFD